MVSDINPDKITLAVPGGLAGQIFAVCYGAWLGENRGVETHLQFHDIGTEISGFALGSLLDTQAAKDLGISYSRVSGNLNWSSGSSSRAVDLVRQKVGGTKAWGLGKVLVGALRGEGKSNGRRFSTKRKTGSISLETLDAVAPGTKLVGYPADYRVIEDAWSLLPELIEQSGLPNFSRETGVEDSVAVHWRLGDYFNNRTHGSITWETLERSIRHAVRADVPIKIFTDSPDLAMELVNEFNGRRDIEYVSSDIWSDLYAMTRSQTFIGSHSGVSFLAALALRMDSKTSRTWLPQRWFLDEWLDKKFVRTPITFGESLIYEVEFNEEKKIL